MVIKKTYLFPMFFLLFGLLTQTIAYILGADDLLSFISGILGVFAVVLTSLRKISMYVFAFLQLFTYMILAYEQRLYGELVENLFYAVTLIAGIFIWLKHYKNNKVETKSLGVVDWLFTIIGGVVASALLYFILRNSDDTQPLMDTLSTIPAFVAQMLMIMRYREQWIFWIIVDITTCILWINVHNWCMVAQYAFWTLNCIYGWILWSKKSKYYNNDKVKRNKQTI